MQGAHVLAMEAVFARNAITFSPLYGPTVVRDTLSEATVTLRTVVVRDMVDI